MADGPQHAMQGMENQNRFDLEQALAAWRNDCLSQSGITIEDAKELEGDLRERIANFLERGMSESKAFAAAVGQVGSVKELAREYAKENPIPIWRERVFWILLAGFAVSVWGLFIDGLFDRLVNRYGTGLTIPLPWPLVSLHVLGRDLPVLGVAALLASEKLSSLAGLAESLIGSRSRLAGIGATCFVIGQAVRLSDPFGWFFSPNRSLLTYWAGEPLLLLTLCALTWQKHFSKGVENPGARFAAVPAGVWRERVLWIALCGVAIGFWTSLSRLSVSEFFYPTPPNTVAKVLAFASLVHAVRISPLLAIGWLIIRWKRGGTITAAQVWPGQKPMPALAALVTCVWMGLDIGLKFLWTAHEAHILSNYLAGLQWAWPVTLAGFVYWLTPRPPVDDQELEPAVR